jgi:hypothetical protein
MARKIRRGLEVFGRPKKIFQDASGGIHQETGTLPVDAFPRYDIETGQSGDPKEKLLAESLKLALFILQREKVLPLAELAHRIVEELMVNPNYTYRELRDAFKSDERFYVTSGQLISLPSVENPADFFFQQMADLKRGKRGHKI